MAKRAKALILAPFAQRWVDRLGEQLNVTYEPWIESRRLHDPKVLAARIRQERFAVVIVEADFLFAEAFAAPSLRVAGVCRNALNQVDLKAATERGIPVIHTPARNAVAVAELVLGLMLSLARRMPAAHAWTKGGQWTNPIDSYIEFRGRELAGSTVGIVGLGHIGVEVAQRVRALGARPVAYDPYVSPLKARALGVRLLSLPALMRRADFITLHLPATKATERLIDGAMIALMKPDAYLLNTGAGAALDHDALAEALRAGRIAGAALDVFPGHILPLDSPLRGLDNIVLTPHIGGATGETVERHSRMIAEDVERFLRGDEPRRLANPEALDRPRRRGR